MRDVFLRVPRELFVPEARAAEGLAAVYMDESIQTKFGVNGMVMSGSSQPAIMAEMLERLLLEPGMRVLEVGAGTGYNAALLCEMVGAGGRVDTVEIDRDSATRARKALHEGGYPARVRIADGRTGFPKSAPYDRIIVTASAETVPVQWFEQLRVGGLAIVPLRLREAAGAHVIACLKKERARFRSVSVVTGGFMPLRDAEDSGIPPSMRTIVVTDLTGGRPIHLRRLSGASLPQLSEAAKRRLVAASLDKPRRRPLAVRADASALISYLSITLPVRRAVAVWPEWGVGVIDPRGEGLAYVASRDGRRTFVRSLVAHGGAGAEEELARAVDRWIQRGSPTLNDLSISVTYDGSTSHISLRYARR